MASEEKLKDSIIAAGKKLAAAQLVCASSGNVSCRLDQSRILITAAGASLGGLRRSDIVTVSLATGAGSGKKRPSSELPLHRLIYRNLDCRVVVHCHPPLTNAFFAVNRKLPVLTFESRYYLGDIPVIPQKSLTVTRPQPVIAALGRNRLAVLKHHGVVCTGPAFAGALAPIQLLEETIRVACVARLFRQRSLTAIDRNIRQWLRRPQQP